MLIPVIGQGTMGIGGYFSKDTTGDAEYVRLLRLGIDLGMTLIDTAEVYGGGHSEELVGEAVQGIRDQVFIATKFSPEHSSYDHVLKAAEGSLRRLDTDYIDLYQIHWPNPSVPLEETMAAIERLVRDGKVRYIGVGNLYLRGLQETQSVLSGTRVTALQTEYNLFDRSIEDEILPYCQEQNITVIAYSPLDQGRIVDSKECRVVLEKIAEKHNRTLAQIALRWLMYKTVPIPKASNLEHVKENAATIDFDLDDGDIQEIDRVSRRPCIRVPPDRIRVSPQRQGNRPVYHTVEEAMANTLGHVPSPLDLAKNLVKETNIKPVHLVRHTIDEYDLVEGRIRYWAWVIAHDNAPIPAYIREDWS